MGVSPYTFAPALRGVLAQRLVRTFKEECKTGECDPSLNTSYDGRMALPELLVVTPAIKAMIQDNEPAEAIEKKAIEEGYRTMDEWGDALIKDKKTSESEVKRVTL